MNFELAVSKIFWCPNVLSADESIPKPTDFERDDSKVNQSPSACGQSTQTEDVKVFVKEPVREDDTKEQGKALPYQSNNETDVWLLISDLKIIY